MKTTTTKQHIPAYLNAEHPIYTVTLATWDNNDFDEIVVRDVHSRMTLDRVVQCAKIKFTRRIGVDYACAESNIVVTGVYIGLLKSAYEVIQA